MKPYSLGLYEKSMPDSLTWKEKLEAARQARFDFVEISIDETEEKIKRIYMTKAERLEMISTMYEAGIPIRSMCVSALTKYSLGNDDPECCRRGMEIIENSIKLADDLGIRVVMIPGYDIFYGQSSYETKKRFMSNIKRVAAMAEKTGVLIGFETMENEFMNTVEKAMKYVVLSDSNYLKIYPDIGNLTNAACRYQNDVLEDLQLGKGNLVAMHLKETIPGRYREVPYGTGHVNFEQAIKTAWKLGIRRFVTEFWYLGAENWRQDLKDAHDRFERILDMQEQRA